MYITDYLPKVAQSVICNGFHDMNDLCPTWISALNESIVSRDAQILATNALDWIESVTPKDLYEERLKLICTSNIVNYNELPIVASMITSYQRNLDICDKYKEVIAENELLAETSDYQGKVGSKIDVDIVDVKRREIYGKYGLNTFFRFIDINGNVYIWSTVSDIPKDISVNHITGTVKQHGIYQGIKQTYLRRVKLNI